jgi:dihydropteroate synthase
MATSKLSQKLKHRRRPLVMGVLNVTPDSFSDGGHFTEIDAALAHARTMLAEGADIIDVGGESTRPGAVAVSVDDELQRVVPVVELLVRKLDAAVSVDTSKATVMQAAIDAGAVMINDVQALAEAGALEVVASADVLVSLMHMQGSPRTMQADPKYGNVVADIIRFLKKRINACTAAGVERDRIIIDPGFGFGKTLAHNYTLLRELQQFSDLGCYVLAGMSRKSMIGALLDISASERLVGSVVLAALSAERGASIVRAHDVRETVEAMKLVQAMQTLGEGEEI